MRGCSTPCSASAMPTPCRGTRGFWLACEDVGVHEAWVVAPVREGWPIGDRARVLSPLELPLGETT